MSPFLLIMDEQETICRIAPGRGIPHVRIETEFLDRVTPILGTEVTIIYLLLCRYADNKTGITRISLSGRDIAQQSMVNKDYVPVALKVMEWCNIIKQLGGYGHGAKKAKWMIYSSSQWALPSISHKLSRYRKIMKAAQKHLSTLYTNEEEKVKHLSTVYTKFVYHVDKCGNVCIQCRQMFDFCIQCRQTVPGTPAKIHATQPPLVLSSSASSSACTSADACLPFSKIAKEEGNNGNNNFEAAKQYLNSLSEEEKHTAIWQYILPSATITQRKRAEAGVWFPGSKRLLCKWYNQEEKR